MTRSLRLLVMIAVAAAIVGTGALYAQRPGGAPGRGVGRGLGGPGAMVPLRQLELTDAQREQVRQLTERHRSDVGPIVERLRTAADARRQAMAAVPVDEGRIRAAVEELARVQADLAVQQARLQSEIAALLTPEQQERARQLQAERQQRVEQRRERMQERLQRQRPPA